MEKLNNIKAIFIDIDGTLTNSKREVTTVTKEAIKRIINMGIKVVICSGRGNKYVQNKAKEANTSEYIITSNGAQIYDFNERKALYQKGIEKDTLKNIVQFINDKKIGCIINCPTIRYSNKYLKRMMDPEELKFNNFDEINDKIFLQLVVETDNYNSMKNIMDYIDKYKDIHVLNISRNYIKGITTDNKYYIDVNNIDVNKGNAIAEFLKIFNISKDDALCFGDHINDTDMFYACKYKIAMGNANEELKRISSYVTLKNDEDGVAYFLNNYII